MMVHHDIAPSNQLHVDVSRIGSSQVRNALRDTFAHLGYRYFEFDAFWPLFSTGEAQRIPTNSLICGDLSHIVRAYTSTQKHRWIAAIRETRPHILAFVRTKADHFYAPWVDDLVRTSDLRVSVCRYSQGSRISLANCVNEAVSSLDPESILDVRYSRSDHSLWIAFGDGLSGSVQPRDIGFDDPLELCLETATVAPYHSGVQVLDRGGDLVDIDGGSLRAVLDGAFAQKILLQAESSNRQIGERLKGHRLTAGVTQVQLAERSGLDQAIISKLERGKHQPRWDTIQRYANGLGVAPESLLA
ncbi:helix-turn-helix transcriptional regulator [Longimicrobium sp.]|jgi:DNA-binding XRE family transcriptional regulator|uniref:helix-turn-helix domain-containing protein n=1 Tax=Longimicrobium sp. TaxID=2029185 RepID=UPI002F92C35F